MRKREYGKCEAYWFLHELRDKIHFTGNKQEIKRIVKLLESAVKNEEKEEN